jgi:cell division septal protein FtsQ
LFREVDLESLRERVGRHPYVKETSVNRDFPSTIRVTVRERIPAALLVVGSRMAVIDEDMVVMPVRHGAEMDNLMIISGSFTIPQTGDTLRHRGVERAMQVVRATAAADRMLYNLFSEISVLNDGGLLAYTTDGGVPVMIGGAVTAERLLSFREFWLQEAVPAGAEQLLSIDLRYEGQVVVRWKAGMRRY